MMCFFNELIEYIQKYPFSFIVQVINAPLYFYIFRIKDDIKFLKWSLISCILFGVGYFEMSAWSGVIFSVFSIVYLLVSFFYKKHNVSTKTKRVTFYVVASLIILLNIFLERNNLFYYHNSVPIMSIIPSLIHAYIYICSSIMLKSSKWLFIFSHILLVTYEFIVVLPLFAIVDIFGLISNTIELIKLYKE